MMKGQINEIFISYTFFITVFLFSTCFASYAATTNSKCKPRQYSHKAVQTDSYGRKCWGEVKIMSCWGFCLTYEIADWQFPYKESHHPVCVHGERRISSTVLKQCDPGVEPGTEMFQYVEAKSCKCKVCSSEDTSCEWLPDINALEGLLPRRMDIEFE